jgi:hypothetical protein
MNSNLQYVLMPYKYTKINFALQNIFIANVEAKKSTSFSFCLPQMLQKKMRIYRCISSGGLASVKGPRFSVPAGGSGLQTGEGK